MSRANAVAVLVLAVGLLSAQPAIEVVSIKPSDPAITAMNNHFSADRFTLIGYAAKYLIQDTFRMKDYQVFGAPEWTRSERWTLEVKTTSPTSYDQKFQLLQPLLADRFQFKYHRETRMMNVYSLVVAKGGPKLTRSEDDDKPAGMRFGNQILAHKYPITMLAGNLSGELNIPVLDKTGLTGLYDIDLKWTPDPLRDFGDIHDPAEIRDPDPNRPGIFTALKLQLGLELKSEKGPVEVIVIDHIERPSPN